MAVAILEQPVATKEEKYFAALELVEQLDQHLENGTRHFRDYDGILLTSLDELINAVLDNELDIDSI